MKLFNHFDYWSISFEEKHPYIAGVICLSAISLAMYGLLIVGAAYGY